jgi:hypothetical protein
MKVLEGPKHHGFPLTKVINCNHNWVSNISDRSIHHHSHMSTQEIFVSLLLLLGFVDPGAQRVDISTKRHRKNPNKLKSMADS